MMRAAHRFGRLEALGTYGPSGRFNDAADPFSLEVVVTADSDLESVVECQKTSRSPGTDPRPFKLASGLWAVDLTASKYVIGVQYCIRWRYEMTPANLKVEHDRFVFESPAPAPPSADGCTIFGSAADAIGMPLSNVDIAAETYKDVVTMTARTSHHTVRTDVFGNWNIEMKHGQLARFVLGDAAKVICVPKLPTAALNTLKAFQPQDLARVDRFGYAYPG